MKFTLRLLWLLGEWCLEILGGSIREGKPIHLLATLAFNLYKVFSFWFQSSKAWFVCENNYSRFGKDHVLANSIFYEWNREKFHEWIENVKIHLCYEVTL